MMKRHTLLALLATLLFPVLSLHADDDTENSGAIWTEVGISKALPYNLSLDLDLGYRTQDWFNESDRYNVGLSLSYKMNKHWKFSAGYSFIMKRSVKSVTHKTTQGVEYKYSYNDATTGEEVEAEFSEDMGNPYTDGDGIIYEYQGYNDETKQTTKTTPGYWRPKHRAFVDVSYSHKFFGLLRITVRERYQLTMMPGKNVSRTKYSEKVSIKHRFLGYDGETGEPAYYTLKYWQEGDVIYVLNMDDQDAVDNPDDYRVDVTEDYLRNHNALNTTEQTIKHKESKTSHILRSRVKLSIDKKGLNWEPYVSFETHNNLGERWNLDKYRLVVGTDYNINKQHSIGLGYVFNHENDDDGNMNTHAISVGYRYKF